MTSYQERKLTMFIVFAQFIQGVLPAILALMPKFNDNFTLFLEKVNQINVLTGNQLLNRQGNRVEKETVRESMCELGESITAKIMGFATNENLYQLYSEVNFSGSYLLKIADTICLATCKIIWQKGKDNLANLGDYGITQEVLDEFKAKIDLYELTIPKPQSGVVSKKAATENLKITFKEASELMLKMFGLAKMIKKEQADFYKDFVNSKRISKPPFTVMSASGVVVDTDGERIGLVLMECAALNFKRKVSRTGGFYLKHMEDGVYEFIFSRPGYETTKVEMVFYKGTRFQVVVVMK
jgi:hypothetical protein